MFKYVILTTLFMPVLSLALDLEVGPITADSILNNSARYHSLKNKRAELVSEIKSLGENTSSAYLEFKKIKKEFSEKKLSCESLKTEQERVVPIFFDLIRPSGVDSIRWTLKSWETDLSVLDHLRLELSEYTGGYSSVQKLLDDAQSRVTARLEYLSEDAAYRSEQYRTASEVGQKDIVDRYDALTQKCGTAREVWERLQEAKRLEPICQFLQREDCYGGRLHFWTLNEAQDAKNREVAAEAVNKMFQAADLDKIRTPFWRFLLGEPDLEKKAEYLYQKWNDQDAKRYEEARSCQEDWTQHREYAEKEDERLTFLHESLEATFESTNDFLDDRREKAGFRPEDLDAAEKIRQDIENFQNDLSVLKTVNAQLKECNDLDSSQTLQSELSRDLINLKLLIDGKSYEIFNMDEEMKAMTLRAESLAKKKMRLAQVSHRDRSIDEALQILIETHLMEKPELENESILLNILTVKGTSLQVTGPFQLKENYERRISTDLFGNQSSQYFHNASNIFDLVTKNQMQCYSGTLNYLLALHENSTQLQSANLKPVAIFTSGHVLPGFVVPENGENFLYGIETTTIGPSKVEFGPTSGVGGEIRIVSLKDFLVVEALKDNIKNMLPVLQQTLTSIEELGFNPDGLLSYDENSADFSKLAPLNRTPFGFGKASVPTLPVDRYYSSSSSYENQFQNGKGLDGKNNTDNNQEQLSKEGTLLNQALTFAEEFRNHGLTCRFIENAPSQQRYFYYGDPRRFSHQQFLRFYDESQYTFNCISAQQGWNVLPLSVGNPSVRECSANQKKQEQHLTREREASKILKQIIESRDWSPSMLKILKDATIKVECFNVSYG